MPTEALIQEVLRGGETPVRRFDPKSTSPFVNKSVSEQTRRAYGRVAREFFQSARMKTPPEIAPNDLALQRDRPRSQMKSASSVAFKLSVICSFYEYLKAAGVIFLNPTSKKLVPPHELPSVPLSPLSNSCNVTR